MANKKSFSLPFIGYSTIDEKDVLIGEKGEYAVVLKITNPNLQFCADIDAYTIAHSIYGHIVKILGEDYIIQKTDIVNRNSYKYTGDIGGDYLDEVYFKSFEGRKYNTVITYLTIIFARKNKGAFSVYSEKEEKDFVNRIDKLVDVLILNKIENKLLNKEEIDEIHRRFLAMDFERESFAYNNINSTDSYLGFGDKKMIAKVLVDIDELNVPNSVAPYTIRPEFGNDFPADNFNFLMSVPGIDTLIYNQVIFIPNQQKIKRDLDSKKKKHKGMPDPANDIAVEDIDAMFSEIAQTNELLVEMCCYVLIYGDEKLITKAVNYVESQLFGMGIICGNGNCNQLELFRSAFPGNGGEIKPYDRFLTSRPSALCFLFTETIQMSENSDYLLYFSDRQGIPVGIDTSEKPMQTQRITNRNKFVLGPSGTGKSYFMNRYLKQCWVKGADVVIVDTGDSYLGTCNYADGKYITYKPEKPITMNPFNISIEENNEEKRQLLKSLLGLIWKGTGTEAELTQVEDSVIGEAIANYYDDYFGEQKEVKTLSFNSFYDFSVPQIEKVIIKNQLDFNLKEFAYILKAFYKGGQYETILNEESDSTLFEEKFIVFEIDNIKEHKLLFPITTLIIMDVFLQKMRHRKNTKKILVIEEAWKAIASPMMAGYILYLYKTVRKFAGEAIVVTQELNDIIGNEIVKDSILANSDTICLLDQSKFKDRYDEIAELLSINDVERNKIFTINNLDNKTDRGAFREIYIRRGREGEVYGVEVPLHEYLTYTTEKSERECLEIYLAHYKDYGIALNKLIDHLNKSKLKLPQFVQKVNNESKIFYKEDRREIYEKNIENGVLSN